MDNPVDFDIAEFKPCQIINHESGMTEYVFEDTAYIAKPVVDGVYHCVDWMVAADDGRLVGIQFWTASHPDLKALPPLSPTQGTER